METLDLTRLLKPRLRFRRFSEANGHISFISGDPGARSTITRMRYCHLQADPLKSQKDGFRPLQPRTGFQGETIEWSTRRGWPFDPARNLSGGRRGRRSGPIDTGPRNIHSSGDVSNSFTAIALPRAKHLQKTNVFIKVHVRINHRSYSVIFLRGLSFPKQLKYQIMSN